MKNIAILGSEGQLGLSIQYMLGQYEHGYNTILLDKDELDITNGEAVNDFFKHHSTLDVLINFAAYTAVDKAEENADLAYQINAEGVKHLVENMPSSSVLIHISTDFVFDGQKDGAYVESDTTHPLGIYGKSKEEGEQALLASKKTTYILRTAWLYSPFGQNFMKTMQKLGSNRPSLNVVDDQFGCPTSSIALAEVIIQLIAKDRQWQKDNEGIYHVTNRGKASWAEFAAAIMKRSDLSCQVNPIPSEEYPTPAKRPKNSVLSSEKIERTLGMPMRSWEEELQAIIELQQQLMLDKIKSIAVKAGQAIMHIYDTMPNDIGVQKKSDDSPLTKADLASNAVIVAGLEKHFPDIPIISEENKNKPYDERKHWNTVWIVDPLDGTKEFIKRNGEFTVNIALVKDGKPVLGVVYVPANETLYYGSQGHGAWKEDSQGNRSHLTNTKGHYSTLDQVTVVASRSHLSEAVEAFVEDLKRSGKGVTFLSAGSSLKFCLVAEGKADVYPRLAPTMEWDTAAAQAVCLEAGRRVLQHDTKEDLMYNREDMLNPWFIVE
ncbi:MAG TPA: hypothetical protein DEO99_03090 [Bacteroidetes bacterium]|nr:hypothetical protein [Bacteroidota bacterium]